MRNRWPAVAEGFTLSITLTSLLLHRPLQKKKTLGPLAGILLSKSFPSNTYSRSKSFELWGWCSRSHPFSTNIMDTARLSTERDQATMFAQYEDDIGTASAMEPSTEVLASGHLPSSMDVGANPLVTGTTNQETAAEPPRNVTIQTFVEGSDAAPTFAVKVEPVPENETSGRVIDRTVMAQSVVHAPEKFSARDQHLEGLTPDARNEVERGTPCTQGNHASGKAEPTFALAEGEPQDADHEGCEIPDPATQNFENEACRKRADSRLRQEKGSEENHYVQADSGDCDAAEQPTATPSSTIAYASTTPQTPIQSNVFHDIAELTKYAECSYEEARRFWHRTQGNVLEALSLAMKAKRVEPFSPVSVHNQPQEHAMPPTLLQEALLEWAKKPLKLQKRGDIAVILDVEDLTRTVLVQSMDAIEASLLFEADKDCAQTEQGVKYLYILETAGPKQHMPLLARKDIAIMRTDVQASKSKTEQVIHTRTMHSSGNGLVKTEDSTPGSDTTTDWVAAHETFFRMLTHCPYQYHGISRTSVAQALPRIEEVAQIVEHYKISSTSAVASAFNTLFSGFINDRQLWKAVAEDAARWLHIGVNLRSSLIFNEAFVHVVGLYPEWPWSGKPPDLPIKLHCAVRLQSKSLHYRHLDVDRQLTFLTLSGNTAVARTVTSIFRDWLLDHLSHIANSTSQEEATLKTDTCDHTSPDADCLTLAGFYRTISKGGDAYLPAESIPCKAGEEATLRAALKDIKRKASKIVAPLLESSLQYEGKDNLKYLTCVKVEDADVPWEEHVKAEQDGEDMDFL